MMKHWLYIACNFPVSLIIFDIIKQKLVETRKMHISLEFAKLVDSSIQVNWF
jgi:hypothetical protein